MVLTSVTRRLFKCLCSMKGQLGLARFHRLLPNEDECLENLFQARFGNKPCKKCGAISEHKRLENRKSFRCVKCNNQVYPLADTIMNNSQTDLRKWITAIYCMTKTRNGVSAMEISRDLEVTYKCAWRMCHKIREAMGTEELRKLCGTIEVDETYIGGRIKGFYSHKNKFLVFGAYERKSGDIRLRHVPNTSKNTLIPIIKSLVKTGSSIHSDEHASYKELPSNGYRHHFVTHKKREWSRGNVTTNRIESCWARFKNSIRGTYIRIRETHLGNYLNEYQFRHNNRKESDKARFLKVSHLVGFDLSIYYNQ